MFFCYITDSVNRKNVIYYNIMRKLFEKEVRQMKYEYVFFDLDGTITDPFDGITNSIVYALHKFGIEVDDRRTLTPFIGPPLVDSFMHYYSFSHGCALAAVGYYREYYSKKGIFECSLYDGMSELLHRLHDNGVKVIMATSKPESFAERLMKHFGLSDCFAAVCGGTMDEKRSKKDDVIAYALERAGATDRSACVMVGDRKFDIDGAKRFGLDSVGVTYGYGSGDEIAASAPTFIADSVAALADILMGPAA